MIKAVLETKFHEIQSAAFHTEVVFLREDIDALSNLNALRALKLNTHATAGFHRSLNVVECFNRIKSQDTPDYLRLLEFCLMRNRVLDQSITRVFRNYFGGVAC